MDTNLRRSSSFLAFPHCLVFVVSYILALIVHAVAPLPSLLHQSLSKQAQGRTGVLEYTLYADHIYTVVLKKVADGEKRSFPQVELLNYRQFRSEKNSRGFLALFPLRVISGCSGPFQAEFHGYPSEQPVPVFSLYFSIQ